MTDLPSSWGEIMKSKAVMMGLKRYSFRREYSASRLAAVGFTNIEFVDSFDGYNEDVDKALQEIDVVFYPNLKNGHKGCSYTHLLQIKRMIDENVPYRVFFEDDVLGHLELPKGLGQKFWDATPKDFDILYMGNMMNPNNQKLNDPKTIVVQEPSYCMHAYILTLRGAKQIWNLVREMNTRGIPINMLDIQLFVWQTEKKIKWYCWNGTNIQKSFPTFDEGLPWQAFADIILPEKDTGLFWQNMRLGTTILEPELQLTIPQYRQ